MWRMFCIFFGVLCTSGLIWAQAPEDVQIQADVFELDTKSKLVFASGNVVVNQSDIKLTGNWAKYNQTEQTVYMYGGVKVTRGLMVMQCDSLYAYSAKEEIVASGNVKFNYKDISGKAGNAKYIVKDQQLVLTDKPRAWQGEDLLTGERILVDLKHAKIRTTGQAKVLFSVDRLKDEEE